MKTLIFGTLSVLSIAAFSPIVSASDQPVPGLPTAGRMAAQRLEYAQKHGVGDLDLTPLTNSNGQPNSQTLKPSSDRSVQVMGTSGGQVRQQLENAQKAPQTNTETK
ncbi:hypothetical protein LEP3755_63460 (plasmid) [Leptolyngbya sp. NIES-3755]|nr:hypothetical protein LEP3755_63460 [Leptolyngbya sp. NIES-3755]